MPQSPPQLSEAPQNFDQNDREFVRAAFAEFERASEHFQATLETLQHRVLVLTRENEHKDRQLARQERLAALGKMAADVAHEIRNPLGGISLYVELLERDLSNLPEQQVVCRKIGDSVGRLNRIVESMLGFTRPIEPQVGDIDTHSLLRDVSDMAVRERETRKVKVDVEVHASTARIRGDAQLLHQTLLNLLRNAIEASPEGANVEVHVAPDGSGAVPHAVTITVRDCGAGISDEHLTKLFTPFFTTKKGGTGLGLALCQRIAEAHGGALIARNHEGGGAAFTLRLPLT